MVICGTVLALSVESAQRESARVDILDAYDLAHAGFENALGDLFAGQSTVLNQVAYANGSYSAWISNTSQSNIVEIQSKGITRDGANALIIADVNTSTHSVLSWSQMP